MTLQEWLVYFSIGLGVVLAIFGMAYVAVWLEDRAEINARVRDYVESADDSFEFITGQTKGSK
jgi:hypothetical protein